MSYPMGPQNPAGYGPPPAGGYGGAGGGGYGPPGFGGPGGGGPGGFGAGPGGPGGFGGPPPGFGGGDRAAAEGKIKPAAITLLVFTGIGMLLQIVSLFMNVLGTGVNLANNGHNNSSDAAAQLMSGVGGIVMNVVGLLAGGFCIYALLKMMKLQGRGLAYTAIIFSMLPCLGSCWCVNLWIGIWALIAMSDQNVKASFT